MDQTAGVGTRRWRPVRAGLRLDGVEPGWSAEVYLRGATVDIAGRGRLAMTKRDTAMMLVRSNVPVEGVDDNPIRLASRQVLGVTRLADGNAPLGESATILNVPEDAFRRFAPSIGHYFGRFEIVPTRYEIECVLPIEKGSTHQRGSYRVVVERVLRGPGVLIAEIRQSMAWSPFDRRARPLRRFYLRNRGAAAAMEGSVDDHDRNDFAVFGLAVSSDTGFSAQRLRVSFPPSHGLQGDSFTLDDRWLDGAELVIVSATMAQPLVRTIEIQSLPLRMPQPEHPAQ